jgi:hypothetical protein
MNNRSRPRGKRNRLLTANHAKSLNKGNLRRRGDRSVFSDHSYYRCPDKFTPYTKVLSADNSRRSLVLNQEILA